ncbi:MAG: DUF2141 domain-containing protein [Hyphomonadaceae bacterium]
MKFITAAAACAAAFVVLTGANEAYAEPIALNVRVDNVRPDQGDVRVAMFAEGAWLSEEPVAALRTTSDRGSVTLRLTAPAAGRYGLAAYQDLNGDGELSRNMIGLPTEPYAFSNNAPLRFGPPAFEDAALTINTSSEAVLTLR